ncbi:MAG: RNA 3'-terminal phosphate cyclase [Candidatus Bathyarchaeota archaeon]
MVIEIDGSFGEGGGQILRMSLALAALVGKPIKIKNVRSRRSPPGIRPQHQTAVKAIAAYSQAVVKGCSIGSTELEYSPRKIRGGNFSFDAETAASTSLILQSLIPLMAFSNENSFLDLHGGTNNPWAPPIDYIQHVFLPILSKTGFRGSLELVRRGFYPQGGGFIQASAEPIRRFKPIVLTKVGEIQRISGLSYSSRLPKHIGERMARSANVTLLNGGFKEANIRCECLQKNDKYSAISPGCGIILIAESSTGAILGSDSLGEPKKIAERVGQEAAESLVKQLKTGVPVSKHLGDQLIIYMALANGRSEIAIEELTLHTLSCIYVSKTIIDANFEILGDLGRVTRIICDGIGLENAF